MKSIIILMIVAICSIALVEEASAARKIMIGQDKGKTLLTERQADDKNANMINDSLKAILASQKLTQALLTGLSEQMKKQDASMQTVIKVLVAQTKAKKGSAAKVMNSQTGVVDSSLALHKQTNLLIKEMLEEQKWLGAILQGYFHDKSKLKSGR